VGEVFKYVAATAQVLGHDIAKIGLELEKLASYGSPGLQPFTKAGIEVRQDISNQIAALDKQLDDFFERINKPFLASAGKMRVGDVPSLGGGGNAKVDIANWNEIADAIKKFNEERKKLILTDHDFWELEKSITKELRDQFSIDLSKGLAPLPTPAFKPDAYSNASKQAQAIQDQLAALNSTEALKRAFDELDIRMNGAAGGARAFFREYADYAKHTGEQVFDALSRAFDGINNNLAEMIVKGKADWQSLLDDIETSIVKIGIQKLEGSIISKFGKLLGVDLSSGKPTGASGDPIHTVVDNSNDFGSFGGGSESGGGGGGLLGGIFGKILGFFTGGGGATSGAASEPGFFSTGGGRATGGPVSAGVLYRVNENHKEYFKPGVSGHVLPLAPAGADGMSGFTYAPTYYISTPDADSFRKSPSQVMNQGLDAAMRARGRR
jgi:hypothetical protein